MKYAFAHMNFFDNNLSIEIVESEKDPIETATDLLKFYERWEIDEVFDSLDGLKEEVFNSDILFDIVELAE